MLIVDEQSMIEAKVVALMEKRCQKFTYGGQCTKLPWGGIPIILFVGDDFQLPAIKSGAFHSSTLETSEQIIKSHHSPEEKALLRHGFNCFKNLGKKT